MFFYGDPIIEQKLLAGLSFFNAELRDALERKLQLKGMQGIRMPTAVVAGQLPGNPYPGVKALAAAELYSRTVIISDEALKRPDDVGLKYWIIPHEILHTSGLTNEREIEKLLIDLFENDLGKPEIASYIRQHSAYLSDADRHNDYRPPELHEFNLLKPPRPYIRLNGFDPKDPYRIERENLLRYAHDEWTIFYDPYMDRDTLASTTLQNDIHLPFTIRHYNPKTKEHEMVHNWKKNSPHIVRSDGSHDEYMVDFLAKNMPIGN